MPPLDSEAADVNIGLHPSEEQSAGKLGSASYKYKVPRHNNLTQEETSQMQTKRSFLDQLIHDQNEPAPTAPEQYPIPPSGFKKIEMPKVRDRDRYLLSHKIQFQNENVNKSLRKYKFI